MTTNEMGWVHNNKREDARGSDQLVIFLQNDASEHRIVGPTLNNRVNSGPVD